MTCEILEKNDHGEALPCGKPAVPLRFYLRRMKYGERFKGICAEHQEIFESLHRSGLYPPNLTFSPRSLK